MRFFLHRTSTLPPPLRIAKANSASFAYAATWRAVRPDDGAATSGWTGPSGGARIASCRTLSEPPLAATKVTKATVSSVTKGRAGRLFSVLQDAVARRPEPRGMRRDIDTYWPPITAMALTQLDASPMRVKTPSAASHRPVSAAQHVGYERRLRATAPTELPGEHNMIAEAAFNATIPTPPAPQQRFAPPGPGQVRGAALTDGYGARWPPSALRG